MSKKCLAVILLIVFGFASTSAANGKDKAPAPRYAFLYGESIPKKGEPGGFGINASHIDWWLVDPDGRNPRKLIDPKNGRAKVRPIDRTIILKQNDSTITLLGPDGADLHLARKVGPLAKADIDSGLPEITTFAFSPGGKAVVFGNAKETICSIDLGTKELTISKITGVNRGKGIQYSPDGALVLYAKHSRKDDFSPVFHQVYVAKADFTDEKKLHEYQDMKELGAGFLPDGRVAVVGPTSIRALDPKTGKDETIAPWKNRLAFRAFGGFSPDGSSFLYDLGGPYQLRLFAFDMKKKTTSIVRPQYLESFQQMVWVRLSPT